MKIEQQERSTKHRKRKKYVRTDLGNSKENTTQTKVKEAKSNARMQRLKRSRERFNTMIREFDPGSG